MKQDRRSGSSHNHSSGFTLIELLVVMGIVAILATVVVVTLNPSELLKQGRDSRRLSDLETLNKALAFYRTDVGGSLGSGSTIYVSIPDTSATCANLGLPSLPSGWTYHCASTSTLQSTDGTGWLPVSFKDISFGSPLGTLPVDPINTTSTGDYYTYVIGGTNNSQYELTSVTESQRYNLGGSGDKVSTDGGPDPIAYELGSNLQISPFIRTLWTNVGDFETGTDGFGVYGGTVVQTSSYGSITGSGALLITASSTCPNTCGGGVGPSFPTLTAGKKYTLSFWAKSVSNPGGVGVNNQNGSGDTNCLTFSFTPTSQWQLFYHTCILDVAKGLLYIYSGVPNQQWVIDDLRIELTN